MRRPDILYLAATTEKMVGLPCPNCGQQWLYVTDNVSITMVQYKCQHCGAVVNAKRTPLPKPVPLQALGEKWRATAAELQSKAQEARVSKKPYEALVREMETLRICARELDRELRKL